MQILKRYWFLPLGILIAVLSFLWGQAESKDSQNSWDLRPHPKYLILYHKVRTEVPGIQRLTEFLGPPSSLYDTG